MNIFRKIVESIEGELKERVIEDVRVGIGYIGVLLDDGKLGLSYTLRDELPPTCSVMDKAGKFRGLTAYDLAQLWFYPGTISSSIGLAIVNAIINSEIESNMEGDVTEWFDFKDKTVGMVGRFDPVIKTLKPMVKRLYIFEKKPFMDAYPDWAARDILPMCDVVIITATTLINRTFLDIVKWAGNAKKILLGPSANFSPYILEHVDMISGTKPVNNMKILEIISQGGGTRQVLKYAKKISVIKK